jgi:UDP-glucose 4-epimerase
MKNYLITGGAGFIGSHLSDALLARGDKVTILDNLSTSTRKINDNVNFTLGSILDIATVDEVVRNCDEVFHLAASVGVFSILNKPLESLINNITGTENVLKSCLKYSKPIFIASSSEIYGKNNKIPLSEDSDRILGSPLLSRWSYSEAKAVDESLAIFYFRELDVKVRLARFFNTVGPRQVGNYGMVLPRFINMAINNEPITVYGDGNQTRCFAHVKDVVRAILLIVDSPHSVGELFNVGNDKQISIMNLAKKIIKITQSKSKIITLPYSEAYPKGFEDMQRRVPDLSKIKSVLGWQPEISLDQIIKDVIVFNTNN